MPARPQRRDDAWASPRSTACRWARAPAPIDPGVLLYLFDELGHRARADVERLLYHESGLLGMSGVSSDMRDLLASDAPAAGRRSTFLYRARRELGSLAAALGGLDALVFTAGIGENQPGVRRRRCARRAWLGVELDPTANARHGPRITRPAAGCRRVVPTDEETMIARHVARLLG